MSDERPMTLNAQLALWVKGVSAHNGETGQCCPDYSCCEPALLAPEEERITYLVGTDQQREAMTLTFLSRVKG